ncbi:MAG TPA: hypothetical protein DEQ43_21745 [Nocardioides bacterium]|nr:hypothetical protein [Nocardioides sp.]
MWQLPRESLGPLIASQAGMLARRQLLAHGVEWEEVETQIEARRWVAHTPRVISTTTGFLTPEQRDWLAVLHAGPRSMLANLSAARRHGLRGWERPHVCVMVDDELSFEPVMGVDFFRSRRPFELLRSPKPGIPSCRLEPALLLWAGYEAPNRAAHGVLAAAVQQRLTSPTRLINWVDQLQPLRRAKPFKRTLSFVDAGAHSGAELEVGRMCRRYAMPQPHRQRRRTDRHGRPRWTDAEWDLADDFTLVLEVDGGFHMEVREASADARRGRRITSRSRIVIRCTAYELIHEAHEVAVDLIGLGVPGRLPPGRVPHPPA